MDPGSRGIDSDGAEADVPVRELHGREPGARVCAHRVERDVAEIEEACISDDDVEADGHDRVYAHDHGGADVGERTEQVHDGQAPDIERIGDGDDQDDRRDGEASRERKPARDVRKRVLRGEDDRDEQHERPGDVGEQAE